MQLIQMHQAKLNVPFLFIFLFNTNTFLPTNPVTADTYRVFPYSTVFFVFLNFPFRPSTSFYVSIIPFFKYNSIRKVYFFIEINSTIPTIFILYFFTGENYYKKDKQDDNSFFHSGYFSCLTQTQSCHSILFP